MTLRPWNLCLSDWCTWWETTGWLPGWQTMFNACRSRNVVELWDLADYNATGAAAVISCGAVRWPDTVFHPTDIQCHWNRATKESVDSVLETQALGFLVPADLKGSNSPWWLMNVVKKHKITRVQMPESVLKYQSKWWDLHILPSWLWKASRQNMQEHSSHILLEEQKNSVSVWSQMCSFESEAASERRSGVSLPTATRRSCSFPDISLSMLSCRVFLLKFLYSTRATNTHQRHLYPPPVSA